MKYIFLRQCLGLLILCFVACSASSKELDIALGWTKPPYVIADGNTGFELEMVKAIFQKLGHSITPIYVPFGRSATMLMQERVDLAMTISANLGVNPDALSDVYIYYQNVALSLKNNHIKLEEVADLRQLSIVAFQNATKVLGDDFRKATEASRLYIELPEQKRQVEMFLLGNADVAILDINIFIYFSRELTGSSQLGKVDIHPLFPRTAYRIGFKDKVLKEQFNQALADYKDSEQYRQLIKQYEFYQ